MTDQTSRPGDEDNADRADIELDVLFAFEPLDEAISVAFLAIKSVQLAVRAVPDTASPERFRDEWRSANVMVRQALRLVDERAQALATAIKRLPRVG